MVIVCGLLSANVWSAQKTLIIIVSVFDWEFGINKAFFTCITIKSSTI